MGVAGSSDFSHIKETVHPGLQGTNAEAEDTTQLESADMPTAPSQSLRTFTLEEVDKIKKLNPKRRYVIVSNELFDVTDFVDKHPGGSSVFNFNNGGDVTETFYGVHPQTAVLKLKSMIIGKIKTDEDAGDAAPEDGGEPVITMEEIEAKHAESKDNIIVIMFGRAYSIGDFAFGHPGGFTTLWNNRGKECGDVFMRIHGNRAKEMVTKFYLGRLSTTPPDTESPLIKTTSTKKPVKATPPPAKSGAPVKRLNSRVLTSFYSTLSINYKYISFACPEKLPLAPGGHVKLYPDPSSNEGRYYTPYRVDETEFYVCMKVYQDGQVSPLLAKKKMGDAVDFEGPFAPKWEAAKDPILTSNSTKPYNRHVLLVAAGTGITPLYAIAKDLLECQVANVTILLSIRTSFDVLLDMELQELLLQFGVPRDTKEIRTDKCYLIIYSTLTNPPAGDQLTWAKTFTGRVSGETFIQARISRADVAIVCGPGNFGKTVSDALLEKKLCSPNSIHEL
ncbi:nitrate reductase (NADH) [Angomonas deanei]|nr:nitrate reductase (NADH) [Angomonas deanei]|eukprot:EPY30041.1 nitrate reductase (NADH) [Angomonas deanei]